MKKTTYLLVAAILALLLGSCKDYKWSNIFDPDNDLPTVSAPVITPQGNTYAVAQLATIACATQGAQIYYTLDGSEPGTGSTLYTEAVFIPQDLTLKARAYKQGFNASQISTASYVITTPTCANPFFSPGADVYSTPQNVVITCTTPGSEIRYTVDGSDPTPASILYQNPVALSTSTTIKARAYKTGFTSSQIVAQVYEFIVAAVQYNPIGGTYTSPQSVALSCPTPGAEIKYTVNGAEPSNSSTPYTQPLSIGVDSIIRAKAFKNGCSPSTTSTASYTIDLTVANPVFAPPPGVVYSTPQQVSISCATPGATIHYTSDGSNPTANSPVWPGYLEVGTNTTIKAMATKSGWNNSQIVLAEYQFNLTLPTPVLDPPSGTYTTAQQVVITCSVAGATLRYTVNGSEPTVNSPVYSGPVTISSNKTLKAKAFKSGWNSSATATGNYIIGLVYDFEGWNGSFFSQSGWQYGTPDQVTPHSGTGLWAMSLSGNYPNSTSYDLLSPAYHLGDNAMISFYHCYYLAYNRYWEQMALPPHYVYQYDTAQVFASADGGVNWDLLTSIQGSSGYQQTLSNWSYVSYDLSAYASQDVMIKFHLWADGNNEVFPNVGWFVDDVQVTNASEVRKGKRIQRK